MQIEISGVLQNKMHHPNARRLQICTDFMYTRLPSIGKGYKKKRERRKKKKEWNNIARSVAVLNLKCSDLVWGWVGRGAARKGSELFWLQTAGWSAGTWSTKVAQQEGNAGIFMTAKECREVEIWRYLLIFNGGHNTSQNKGFGSNWQTSSTR